MAQYETKFAATTLPATLSLGSTGWQRFISAYYDFVINGTDEQRLYEMQVTDASSDIVYRQRIGVGTPAAMSYAVQIDGVTTDSSTMVDYGVAGYQINTANFVSSPPRLLIPPGSFIRVTSVNDLSVPSDTVALTLVTEDA